MFDARGDVACDESLEGIGTELSAAWAGEHRIGWFGTPFRQPGSENRADIWPQGRTPHLPSFSEAADMSADSELYILATRRGELVVPHAGLNRHQQERTIPPANPCLSVRADTSAVASSSVRNSTGPFSKRFAGIARMRWHCMLSAGSASETYRKNA